MTVTTLHDYKISKQVRMVGSVTFYGVLIAATSLGDPAAPRLQRALPEGTSSATVSMHDHQVAKGVLLIEDITFYGVLLALIYMADTDNLASLENEFALVASEAKLRYHAPGGAINSNELETLAQEHHISQDAALQAHLAGDDRVFVAKGCRVFQTRSGLSFGVCTDIGVTGLPEWSPDNVMAGVVADKLEAMRFKIQLLDRGDDE